MAGAAAAASYGARGALSPHTLLFDLPPVLLGDLCAVLDSCDGALGWRGLGECGPQRRAVGLRRARSVRPAAHAAGQLRAAAPEPGHRARGLRGLPGSVGEAALSPPWKGTDISRDPREAPHSLQRNYEYLCKTQ